METGLTRIYSLVVLAAILDAPSLRAMAVEDEIDVIS